MNQEIKNIASASVTLGALALSAGCASQASVAPLEITPASARGAGPGSPEYFTGEVRVSMLFGPQDARRFGAADVSFEPGARTAWHTHPAGQTLVVLSGEGWVQVRGEARREIHPGDVVWIPPHVLHWHGATATSPMTHTALQGEVDGAVVSWGELVSEGDYLGGAEGE